MGSPLSSIISEIYLQTVDEKISKIVEHNDPQGYWFRYVDDGLYISNNKGQNTTKILQEINKINPKLTFTVEEETESKLNFLDITIFYNTERNQFLFSIYRKPTQTSSTIPASSNHPPSHKMAAYNALIYRMLKISLKKHEIHKERQIIHQIAVENGYTPKTIYKLEKKVKEKIKNRTLNGPDKETDKKWTAFTYIGNQTKKITKIFKPLDIRIAYKRNQNTLNRINSPPKIDDAYRNGVYSIQCPECDNYYIGQTKKKLLDRYQEHKKAYTNPQIYKSNLATHSLNNNHNFPSVHNIKLIKEVKKGLRMDIWENMNIFKFKNNNKLIEEQKQLNTKQDLTFNIIKIHNVKESEVGNSKNTNPRTIDQSFTPRQQKQATPPPERKLRRSRGLQAPTVAVHPRPR